MVRTKRLIHMSWIVLREITGVFATNAVKKREKLIICVAVMWQLNQRVSTNVTRISALKFCSSVLQYVIQKQFGTRKGSCCKHFHQNPWKYLQSSSQLVFKDFDHRWSWQIYRAAIFKSTIFPEIPLATGSVYLFKECFSFLLVSGNQCFTRSAEFKLLCLNKAVLKNVLVCLNQTKDVALEKEPTHK